MSAIATIERVLAGLDRAPLNVGMVTIPETGASEQEIKAEEVFLSRPLSAPHAALLKKWNGLNLDMIRIYGVGAVRSRIRRLKDNQLDSVARMPGFIAFGSDPSGFVYAEGKNLEVYCFDTDGGDRPEPIASNIEDFFGRYVFGPDSDKFIDTDWKEGLRQAGIF
jgi:hypothetical protein